MSFWNGQEDTRVFVYVAITRIVNVVSATPQHEAWCDVCTQ